MSLPELLEFLEGERSALLERASEVSDLYRSLSESLRTLAVPFRSSLASMGSFESALNRENRELRSTGKPSEGKPGDMEHNTSRLVALINQVYAVRNLVLPALESTESGELSQVRQLHAEILAFLEELYQQNTAWILQDPGAEASIMARQKRRDIEEILKEEIDPFFERLTALRRDLYSLRLNVAIRRDAAAYQRAVGSPQAFEGVIQEQCTALGLPFAPERSQELLRDLAQGEGELERRVRERHEERPEEGEVSAAALRRRYLAVLQRYLARVSDVSALLAVAEEVYDLYQPRPSLMERLRVFLARLFGRDERPPRRDVEFNYVVGKDQIERRRASLEDVIRGANNLEKMLLRIKNHINEYMIHKRLAEFPVARALELIERTRGAMRRIFEDCSGLVQWLGKAENRDKLALLPQNSQRDFGAHLDSIYATLIINAERLREVELRQADAQAGEGGGASG
ncbi:MAG: hypothetical protein JW820_11540 [Spirochaetales bacterium]|nr:hypothetical protein [Spirochaetales bacterium]